MFDTYTLFRSGDLIVIFKDKIYIVIYIEMENQDDPSYIPPNPSPQISQKKPSPQIIRHSIMNEIAV